MRRYIEIYSIMLRNSLIRDLSFKANFLLWMVVEILWFCGQIVFFSIIFVNLANIPELVRMGKLDSVLVLPIDSQFAVSTKQFGLDSIINALLGAAVVCVSLSKLSIVPNPLSILLYVVALGFGIAVHYSIMLGLAAVSFWIIRAQGLVYGYFNFLNIARYPDVIFPWLFRLIFGWIIPVVIIANIPARLLIKSLGQPWWLMLHLVMASSIVFLLSRGFWKFALRRYSSASSWHSHPGCLDSRASCQQNHSAGWQPARRNRH